LFELPELVVLSHQINATLTGKTVRTGNWGNSPHKFVWHNLPAAEFAEKIAGKTVGEAFSRGRWLFIPLESGLTLLLGELGGKFLYHKAGEPLPKKYHMVVEFEDSDFLTETTQMWGAMELYEGDAVWEREYVVDMRPTPLDEAFTFDYFNTLIEEAVGTKKTSAKALLTQEQRIPGLGNACVQDILFRARVHPRQDMAALDDERRRALYDAIRDTVNDIIAAGGRYDEVDLFGDPGGYVRLMDKRAKDNPCPECGTNVEKISYLGGACYLCPACQKQV
jgi:formamidopyrimidine-DNA glycosylase